MIFAITIVAAMVVLGCIGEGVEWLFNYADTHRKQD